MHYILPLHEITVKDRGSAGGKAAALGSLVSRGIPVPRGICISARAYSAYMDGTGLRERIMTNENIPRSLRGLPIALVTAALMSIAFMGFAGLI